MKMLLDTDACVNVLRGLEPSVTKFDELGADGVVLSAMTVAELLFGNLNGQPSKAARTRMEDFIGTVRVIPFDFDAAQHHAHVRLTLQRASNLIGDRDMIIAATALAHDLVVATGNTREFSHVPGLKVEEWR